MIDPRTPIDQVPLVFLDVETTGLAATLGDRICEVAALRCQNGEVTDALQRLVNPQRSITPGAYRVHGIDEEMLRDAPLFAEVADDLLALLENAVFVGHNAPFDLGFLHSEFARIGMRMPPLIALDTLLLARRHYRLPGYSLTRLAAALGVEVEGRAHRAMVDALLTRGVFRHIVDELRPRGVRTLADFLAAQGGVLNIAPSPNIEVPPVIQEALSRGKFLYLRYLSQDGVESERLVRPIRVMPRNGNLFLMAHCLMRDAERSFRLDRILDIDLVERFE
ncbi:MAG TPA: WYL domain-containing protein [Chloroflexi bacterium]|jgi:DNA polymerase-3 subunit epsilon|nr:WYL domain-containing protein [Chloroflexota bacterium]